MKIPEELLPVVEWWEKNGKKAVVVAVIAGLVGLTAWSLESRAARKRDAAADALAESTQATLQCLTAAEDQKTTNVEKIEALLQDHGDSANATALKLLLASAKFARGADGDYEAALAIYDELAAAQNLATIYKNTPAFGRAHCLEALGKYDDAVQAYAAIAAAAPESDSAVEARLGQARALVASGKKAEAVALVDEVIANAKTPLGEEVAKRTGELVKGWVAYAPAPVAAETASVVAEPAPVVADPAPVAAEGK